jgi:hypothetical protein
MTARALVVTQGFASIARANSLPRR